MARFRHNIIGQGEYKFALFDSVVYKNEDIKVMATVVARFRKRSNLQFRYVIEDKNGFLVITSEEHLEPHFNKGNVHRTGKGNEPWTQPK